MKALMHFSLVFCLFFLSAGSFADTPVSQDGNASSRLIIYRPKIQNAQSALYYRVFVDQKYLGKLKNGRHFMLQLTPGKHVLSANSRDNTTLAVSVDATTTSVVRAEISRQHKLSFRTVSAQQALEEAPELVEYFSDKDPARFALQHF